MRSEDADGPAGLPEWLETLAEQLGAAGVSRADRMALLDVARQVAHGVCRPAAPLTTYLIGVAVGRGADLQAAATVAARLADGWSPESESSSSAGSGPAVDG